MSRCFPYTLREGCVKRGTLRETLMGSLKLQKEKENAVETKRSKPNKREKEKRETHLKPLAINDSKVKRPSHGKPPAGLRKRKVFDSDSPPVSKDSYEQAEKSSITEEHEQPVGYLSDGSKSSKNESRQDASASSIERCGNILRIRLKRTATADSPLGGQPECSTSGTAYFTPKNRRETSQVPCQINATSIDARELVVEKPETSAQLDIAFPTVSSSTRNESLELESAYEALIEHWVPLPLDHGLDESDDQDWLFDTKRAEGKGPKKLKSGDDAVIPCTWPPQAHFLPEAEIYALPYTVPL
ncbi:uncharacterized protein LOC115749000 [Rhodamnia argentea]|uniref:Uncharacterized protein LOC115749000 n=1 Tax=Rhodamnia argentea TaxID=178133 RepID=A0A8B8Q368_9MYRT|nr:uncharacterized protein LOC115749000 [Rhodamnia argentea]